MMLILRRKVGERLVINGIIQVTVLAVDGERVKIGIIAPPEVSVVRAEVQHRRNGTAKRANVESPRSS